MTPNPAASRGSSSEPFRCTQAVRTARGPGGGFLPAAGQDEGGGAALDPRSSRGGAGRLRAVGHRDGRGGRRRRDHPGRAGRPAGAGGGRDLGRGTGRAPGGRATGAADAAQLRGDPAPGPSGRDPRAHLHRGRTGLRLRDPGAAHGEGTAGRRPGAGAGPGRPRQQARLRAPVPASGDRQRGRRTGPAARAAGEPHDRGPGPGDRRTVLGPLPRRLPGPAPVAVARGVHRPARLLLPARRGDPQPAAGPARPAVAAQRPHPGGRERLREPEPLRRRPHLHRGGPGPDAAPGVPGEPAHARAPRPQRRLPQPRVGPGGRPSHRRRPRRADQREPGGGLESAAGPDRPRRDGHRPSPQNHQETTA